jgi:prephenate dehydrogenase
MREPQEAPFSTIAIAGLGLVGGSIALAVRRAWPGVRLIGVDIDRGVLQAAESGHVVDLAADDLAAVRDADLVVLAAPVCANIRLVGRVPDLACASAIVTDVGSTKRAICHAASRLFPSSSRGRGPVFVGGHPVAGSAAGGLGAASADLFTGARWIFTPEPGVPEAARRRLAFFAAGLGARPLTMDAAEHDRLMAFLSHLPQLVASVLMTVVGDGVGPAALAGAGSGLRDTTRLADSPAGIWADICATNAGEIRGALAALTTALACLDAQLTDPDYLGRIFDSARALRAAMGDDPRSGASRAETELPCDTSRICGGEATPQGGKPRPQDR